MNQEEILQAAREQAQARVVSQVDDATKTILDEHIARFQGEVNEAQEALNAAQGNLQAVQNARESLNQPVQEEVPAETLPEDNQG